MSDMVATTVLIVPRQHLMRAVYSKRVISNLKKTCRRCVSVYTNVSKEEKNIKRANVKKEVKKKVVHITLAPVPAPKPKPAPTPVRKFNYGLRNQVETIENLTCDFQWHSSVLDDVCVKRKLNVSASFQNRHTFFALIEQ